MIWMNYVAGIEIINGILLIAILISSSKLQQNFEDKVLNIEKLIMNWTTLNFLINYHIFQTEALLKGVRIKLKYMLLSMKY